MSVIVIVFTGSPVSSAGLSAAADSEAAAVSVAAVSVESLELLHPASISAETAAVATIETIRRRPVMRARCIWLIRIPLLVIRPLACRQ
jgi:hypothetical protein